MRISTGENGNAFGDQVSTSAINLANHVRTLANTLRDRTESTPYAAESLALADEVDCLCDYVVQLHDFFLTLPLHESAAEIGMSSRQEESDETQNPDEVHRNQLDRKAMEIQREIHSPSPNAKDVIKALFMWRDSPEQRLRNDDL